SGGTPASWNSMPSRESLPTSCWIRRGGLSPATFVAQSCMRNYKSCWIKSEALRRLHADSVLRRQDLRWTEQVVIKGSDVLNGFFDGGIGDLAVNQPDHFSPVSFHQRFHRCHAQSAGQYAVHARRASPALDVA